MAIHIHNSKNLSSAYLDVPIHLLPCKIHADCDARVKKYFNPGIKEEDNGTYTASFRGYPLRGSKLKLPENYQGAVLHESIKPMTENEERKFFITHKFNNFTYWNWDKMTSKNDMVQQAMDWIEIAEVLHAPIKDE